MFSTDDEYRELIKELNGINRELVDAARVLPKQVGNSTRHWVTDLDSVIEKHRAATSRLRDLVTRRKYAAMADYEEAFDGD